MTTTATQTMEIEGPKPDTSDRVTELRLELKEWEKCFAAANEGRKAGREDIKKDPTIAAKYKDYAKLRDVLSGKEQPAPRPSTSHEESRSRKRKSLTAHESTQNSEHTPKKHRQAAATPSKSHHPSVVDPYDSPATVRKLQFTPSRRTAIGPTPQKDGKILGLFDLLSDDENDTSKGKVDVVGTPSKSRSTLLHGTPSKGMATPSKSNQCTPLRQSRTPASVNKTFLFAEFATPLKHKTSPRPEVGNHSSTPAFLRRRGATEVSVPAAVDEEGNPTFASPVARRPARPPVRGLSSILAGLRQMEDERLDDEMDILREIEGNVGSGEDRGREKGPDDVKDSEAGNPDLAGVARADLEFREGSTSDKDEEAEPVPTAPLMRNGKPWKKRGQKRQTRRVIRESLPIVSGFLFMRANFATVRPVHTKPPQPSAKDPPQSPSPTPDRGGKAKTPEITDVENAGLAHPSTTSPHSHSHSPSPSPSNSPTKRKKSKPLKSKSGASDVAKSSTTKDQPDPTKKKRKKAAPAQNFRRLKLGPGHGQRSGRGGRRGRR
ncbi:MAG: hypothetical protein M4579_006821 [Chaenotheca gracillima]|nr:MAG: hypothetical protein M4579_006821 [Chaenotheca gracillima]